MNDGVKINMLTSSEVDHGFKPWLGQTKVYKISTCCFFAKHAALRNKSKDGLALNQNNVCKWSIMSTYLYCFCELASLP